MYIAPSHARNHVRERQAHPHTHTDTHTHASPACSESLTCAGGATQKARLLAEGVTFSAAGKVSGDCFWDPDSDDELAED